MGEKWTAPRHGDVAGAKRQMFVGRTRTDTALAAARLANTAKLRRRRLIERVHQIAGLRGLVELFEELVERDLLDETELERRLSRYAGLDADLLRAVGALRFPHPPIRIVGRGRQ